MPYLKRSDDISIFYLDEGAKTAPAVLLIHGLACDLHDWSWQIPFLLNLGFRVISPDLRGHGRSSAPTPSAGVTEYPGKDADPSIIDYYPQTTAGDIVALLEHLEVASIIIVSHSMGDLVGYAIATSRPDLVQALVGLDPIHAFDNATRAANTNFFDDPAKCLELLLLFFKYNSYGPEDPEWLKTWHLRRAAGMDPMVTWALCWGGWGDAAALGRTETAAVAFSGKLKCPRLTLGSSEWQIAADRHVLPKGSELDETVVIEGKGHWFQQTDSEKFNGILKAWFEKIDVLPR